MGIHLMYLPVLLVGRFMRPNTSDTTLVAVDLTDLGELFPTH